MIAKIKLTKYCKLSDRDISYNKTYDAILVNNNSVAVIAHDDDNDIALIQSEEFLVIHDSNDKSPMNPCDLNQSISLLKPKRVLMEFE